MSVDALEHFRALITESFTLVAVDVFKQVQTLVKSYEDENKRLRSLLNSVLQPEVRLPKIEYPELMPQSQEAPDEVKDEQMECVIGDDFNITVKSEPEETNIDNTSSFFEVTVSATGSAHDDSEETEEEATEQCETEQMEDGKVAVDGETSESMNARQKTLLETPRFKKPDSSLLPTPDEYREFISRLSKAYQNMPKAQRPLITSLGLDKNMEFVDCALGKVPKGSPLSYQYPVQSERDFTPLDDAPPQPRLPLQSQKIDPLVHVPTLTENEQAKLNKLKLTWEMAYNLEQATRTKKEIHDGLKGERLMNCFGDIFSLKEGEGHADMLTNKIKRGKRKSKLATIEQEQRIEALREYCRLLCINCYPCGLVVHPGAPWLAAFPDRLVYDPNESISFGLLHVKCESNKNFIECKYLRGTLELKSHHPLYWHIQGEMMVTGTAWCDLLVYCADDMLVQRIYRDEAVIKAMKLKVDGYFFNHFLRSLF